VAVFPTLYTANLKSLKALSANQIAAVNITVTRVFLVISGQCKPTMTRMRADMTMWMIWKVSYCSFRSSRALANMTSIANPAVMPTIWTE